MPIKWPPELKWDSPTGKLLSKLGEVIPANRRTPVILFGSGALQLTITPSVLSADADIAPDIVPYDPKLDKYPNPLSRDELTILARQHGLGPGDNRVFLHICALEAFNPGTRYLRRVAETSCGNIRITIPHPIDILVAKLHRYDKKDQSDFEEVVRRTNFPSPDELLAELQASPRLFDKRDKSLEHVPRQFGESRIAENVPKVFRDLWGRHISVKRDIIVPANKAIQSSYHTGSHKKGVGDLAAIPLSSEKRGQTTHARPLLKNRKKEKKPPKDQK